MEGWASDVLLKVMLAEFLYGLVDWNLVFNGLAFNKLNVKRLGFMMGKETGVKKVAFLKAFSLQLLPYFFKLAGEGSWLSARLLLFGEKYLRKLIDNRWLL